MRFPLNFNKPSCVCGLPIDWQENGRAEVAHAIFTRWGNRPVRCGIVEFFLKF
jgi:hypothetical protein